MRTILYPDGNIPDPYIVNSRDGDYALYIISALLIFFFWCVILYHFSSTPNDTVFQYCAPGQCPTNIKTGQKRCGAPDQALLRELENEVCNPPTACTNPQTPYAINSDGSYNITGICDDDNICRCAATVSCPYFTEVLFTRTSPSGNYLAPDFYFEQTPRGSTMTGGKSILIGNVTTETCTVGLGDTARFTIGGCTSFSLPDDVAACVESNPCSTGVLTFVPSRTRNIHERPFVFDAEAMVTPVACIAGTPCTTGTYPVFDWDTARVVCVART
jgi:hypothetical protein